MPAGPSVGVSIGMPTLDEEGYLRDSLDSLADRIAEAPDVWPVEVVVADGGSDDATREIAANHPVVDTVGVVEQDGVLWGRVAAVEMSTNPIHVQVDADATYEPGWLEALVSPLGDPGVVMTIGKAKGEGFEYPCRVVYERLMKAYGGNYACGANRAYRKSAFQQAGYDLSDEGNRFFFTSLEEEVRFVNRMESLGEVEYVPEAVSWQSDRHARAILTASEKDGGATWT